MTKPFADVVLPTRRLDPALLATLRSLSPGERISIIRTIRVGSRRWSSRTDGTFEGIAYLNTGITTDRVREDDLVVPVLRFNKSNGELSSITVDEHVVVETL